MEAVLLQSSSQNQQQISPYNRSHIPNPKRMMMNNNYSSFISRPVAFAAATENLLPPSNNNIHTGLLQTPPNHLFFSHSSLPPYFPAYGNVAVNGLSLARGLSLPYPINNRSKPTYNNNNNNNRRRSSKNSSLTTSKKSKASASASNNSPKKEDKSKMPTKVAAAKAAKAGEVASESWGTEPKDLLKVVSSSMGSRNSSSKGSRVGNGNSVSRSSSVEEEEKAMEGHGGGDQHDKMDLFTGSMMFTPSPPPSSLPLPTFSLRPKLSCNAEAAATGAGGGAGVDAGATDNLRRLLRLR